MLDEEMKWEWVYLCRICNADTGESVFCYEFPSGTEKEAVRRLTECYFENFVKKHEGTYIARIEEIYKEKGAM